MKVTTNFFLRREDWTHSKPPSPTVPPDFGLHLAVGDTIAFPEVTGMVFEVSHRHVQIDAEGTTWHVFLRSAPNPLDNDEILRRS